MKKFWTIFRQEYAQVVQKKSFIFGVLITPVMMAAFTIIPGLLISKQASSTEWLAIVDQSGYDLGNKFEQSLVDYKLEDKVTPYYGVKEVFTIAPGDSTRYRQVYDSLRQAVNDKEVKYVMVFGENPQVGDSNFFVVTNAESFRSLNRFERKACDLLSEIRLEQASVNLPVDSIMALTRRTDLPTRTATGESLSFSTKYFSALAAVGIMFFMILAYGRLVMGSIIEEKNSRVMEVMVSSVTPFQLMLGKIFGLGAATLTQVGIWLAIGATLFIFRGSMNYDPAVNRIIFNPAIIIFFALLLMSGYLLFSTLFALIGSVVNEEKEAQNFLTPITISLVLPFILATYIVQEPNSTASTVLSFIPLFTPTLMLMRLVFVVPTSTDLSPFSGIIAQGIIGLVIVWITTIFMIWVTARIFRVGILMYGKRPTLPEIVKWVRQ